jgi:hypothetical protein
MGLLDDLPYGLLNQIRNATQSRVPNANSGAGDVDDLPSWAPRQPPRAPLSFAGPDLTADIAASSPGRSADFLRALMPAPPAPNLTVQALRMKGAPEADISAATGNPELMKQLVIQHYGPGSTWAPALHRADANSSAQLNDPSGIFAGSEPRFDSSASGGGALIQPVGLKCKGFPAGCPNGGNFGETGRFNFDIGNLCRFFAIRYTGAGNRPANEQIEILKPFARK